MIMDKLAEFSDNVAVTGSGDTAHGEAYDLGVQPQQLGPEGVGLWLNVLVTADIAGASVQVKLVSDAQDPVVPGSATEHVDLPPILAGTAAGFHQAVKLPLWNGAEYERYMGIVVDRGGSVSGGALSTFLTLDTPANRAYADAEN